VLAGYRGTQQGAPGLRRGVVVAFLLFFQLIAAIGPTRSTVITHVNPAVAVALGVLVLDEQLTPGMLVGFPLILAGSILGARKATGLSR
jgi:drug/metabolite transporter (DMT)-like permease